MREIARDTKEIKILDTQKFIEFVRQFDPVSQEVLRILISSNAAMSVQTIRNAYIQHQTTQNASKLQAFAEHLTRSPQTVKASVLNKNKKLKDAEALKKSLYKLSKTDSELFLEGIDPLPPSEKLQITEAMLKTLDIQIPARETIGSILQTLAQAGIVKITIPSGKKADAFYFISSRVYDLWYMQREQLKDKTNKTDAEKFWFG